MPQRYKVLSLLFLLSIITFVDRVCLAVAGPRIQDDLHLSPDQWGWITGVFALAYGGFEIPSGAMGDRYGARLALTRIVAWWSAFTAITGAVTSYAWMLVVRFLFGAGEAGAYPNSSSAISRWFPVEERARAQGFVWMAGRLGGAITPLLVVPIQMRFGWRASFWIFGAVGLAWVAVWYTWYCDHPRGESAPPSRRLPWKQVLRSSNFWTLLLMYHLYCYGGYFYQSWLHTYMAKGRGFGEQELKLFSVLPFLMGALANCAGGFAADALVRRIGLRAGRRAIGVGGLTASAAFTLAAAFSESKEMAVVFLSLGLAGSDFMLPTAWAVCLDIGRNAAGVVSGAMNGAGQMGSMISSILFGVLVTKTGSYDFPLIPISGLVLISAMLWFKIDPTRQLDPLPEAVYSGTQVA
jgi:MFS transporter, ACS family, glucarate transporter